MGDRRVTIKAVTVEKLKRLLETGDSVTALRVVTEILDQEKQGKLRWCKRYAYTGFLRGQWDYQAYRRLSAYADSFIL